MARIQALPTPAACAAIFLATAASLPAQRTAADLPRLFTAIAAPPAAAVDWNRDELLRNPTILRSAFVRIDASAIGDAPGSYSGEVFGESFVVDFAETSDVLGYTVHVGKVRGSEMRSTFTLARDGIAAGTLWIGDMLVALSWATSGDVHVAHEIDMRHNAPRVGPLDPGAYPTEVVAGGAGSGGAGSGGADASNETITLMDMAVFYTPAARTAAGGTSAIETLIVNGVARASATAANSFIAGAYRLVYVAETNYVEDGSTGDLSRFRSTSDGIMDEVHAARTTYGADLMHLITQPATAQYGGVAYLMTTLSTGFRTAAFAVTLRAYVNSNVIAHEAGHNVGCHHDRANAGSAIYPYAYGYRTPDNAYRTVMSYSPGTRTDYYSSPAVRYLSYTMGVADSEDNARTITNTKGTVASFYPTSMLVWCPIAGGVRGQNGVPSLTGDGTKNGARPITLTVGNTRNGAIGAIIVGTSQINLPILGTVLIPSPDATVSIVGNGGNVVYNAPWLGNVSAGRSLWFQAAFVDAAGPQGISASGGLKVTLP